MPPLGEAIRRIFSTEGPYTVFFGALLFNSPFSRLGSGITLVVNEQASPPKTEEWGSFPEVDRLT